MHIHKHTSIYNKRERFIRLFICSKRKKKTENKRRNKNELDSFVNKAIIQMSGCIEMKGEKEKNEKQNEGQVWQ